MGISIFSWAFVPNALTFGKVKSYKNIAIYGHPVYILIKNTVDEYSIKLLAVREYGPNFVPVFTFIVTSADPISNVGDQIGLYWA